MMKKKIFILQIIFFILICALAQGAVEKFNDWVYDGDIITIDKEIFKFRISDTLQDIQVTHNSNVYPVKIGSCEDGRKIRICFNETFADPFYDDRRARVKISYHAPNITISRETDKPSVEISDDIDFSVVMKNEGDLEAESLSYIDSFPPGISITSISRDCSRGRDNSVIYSGTLKRGEKVSCSYTVVPTTETDVKLKAQIDYYDGFKEQRIYSSLINIKSTSLFKITANRVKTIPGGNDTYKYEFTSLEKSDIEVGEKFRLQLNITNQVEDALNFDRLEIKLPPQMNVEYTNMKNEKGVYIWSGTLPSNTTKEFTFLITPAEDGNFELVYSTYLKKKGSKQVISLENNKINFQIKNGGLALTSSLDTKNIFDSGKEIFLSFQAQNTHNYMDVKDIRAAITSTLLNTPPIYIKSIESNKSALVYKTVFISPEISSQTTYKVKMEVNYSTESGVKKTKTKEWSIAIKPLSDIEIKKTISKTKITEGDDVGVIVKVKNTRSKPIYSVRIEENLPYNLSRNGKTTAFIDMIMPGEIKNAYSYTIHTPKVKNKTSLQLNTTLSFYEESGISGETTQKSITLLKPSNVVINPKKISLSIKKSADYTTIDLGELAKVTYTIENKDTETAHDIRFEFSTARYVDLVGEHDYYLERLEPGEVVTFQKEMIRPKKSGRYNAGETMIHFKDMDGNNFNYTINTLVLNVKERPLAGPAIILSKKVSPTALDEGDVMNMTLTAENIGDEPADIDVVDGRSEEHTSELQSH